MLYLWLKALHVAAVLVFLGGLAVLAVTAASLSKAAGMTPLPEQARLIRAVHRWDRLVTSPALGLVWVLGLVLAWKGGWFDAPWLMIKLCFVVFLSAIHGMMSGTIRRAANGNAKPMPGVLQHFPAAIVVSAVVIAVLAVVKPFGV
ncbi:MAG: CopD family protein [Trinickia sp.]